MIAYRAETAMVGIVRESLSPADDVRSLVQDLFRLEADLLPDAEKQQLPANPLVAYFKWTIIAIMRGMDDSP